MSKKSKGLKKAARREAKALARAIDPAEIRRPPASEMAEEVAKPGMTGVRRAWSPESMADGLTPDRLSALLRQANEGDLDDLLTLAEEMEERDPHYASVLGTRKLAVLGLERQLTWSKGKDEDPRADEIHEACSNLVDAPTFEGLLSHLLDAIAKPYAVAEPDWLTTSTAWTPVAYHQRDPRWFKYDKETGRQLRLKEDGQPDGVELKPGRFVVAEAANKSGLPARRGLMRLVAFSFVCKLYGLKDWMAYAEIFGIPMRLGKYGAGSSPADVEVLKRAVFGLGSDAAAVIPESMKIEFPNLGAAGGAELFKLLVEWLDSQISKAILGQTGTTDMKAGGFGGGQAKVQDEVRTDLLKADAKWLAAIVTHQLLTPFVRWNYGPDAPVPNLVLVVDEPEDIANLSTALEKLVPLGLEVDHDEVMKKLKLSPAGKGAKLLRPRAPANAPPVDPATAPADPPNLARDERTAARARVDAIFAEAAARRATADDQLDAARLAAMDGWERVWGDDVAAVMALARECDSFASLTAGLAEMAKDLAKPAAARSLANAMFQAAVVGQAQVRKAG